MSDGRKRILSPFTGRKKLKVWKKTKENHMPVQQTGDHYTEMNDLENI